VKIKNFIPENASFQGYFTEVSFETSEGNQLSYFQNGYFLQNSLVISGGTYLGKIQVKR
jgi:hypothetical protein